MANKGARKARKQKRIHPAGPEKSKKSRGRPWRWAAIGIIATGVAAITLVIVKASSPESLSFSEVLRASGHLHALAVRPVENGAEILLGTHNGLYVSGDNGKTWRLASERTDFMAFAGFPAEKVFYAGGHDIAVLRSVDGGKSWEKAGTTLPHHDVHVLGADPANPSRVYAWVVGHGLFETSDVGKTWKLVNSRLARVPIASILVRRNSSNTLLVGTGDGVAVSKDRGVSWQLLQNELKGKGVFALLEVQGMPGHILAGTKNGLFLSTDAASSFKRVEQFLISGRVIALAQSKVGDALYALTNAGGIFRSQDGGNRWVGIQ